MGHHTNLLLVLRRGGRRRSVLLSFSLRPLASRYMRPMFTSSRGREAEAEEDSPEMPYSSVLSMNMKRRATHVEVYDLKSRDGSSVLRSAKQEETVGQDDEERLWPIEESRKELELYLQSTSVSNNDSRMTDDGSTSTLSGKSDK